MTGEKEKTNILINNIPADEKEEFARGTKNMAGKLRNMIYAHNRIINDEYEVNDEMERIALITLKTYRNAIEQNIQVLKNQRDKLDERIEEFESDDDQDEILITIDLEVESKNI